MFRSTTKMFRSTTMMRGAVAALGLAAFGVIAPVAMAAPAPAQVQPVSSGQAFAPKLAGDSSYGPCYYNRMSCEKGQASPYEKLPLPGSGGVQGQVPGRH